MVVATKPQLPNCRGRSHQAATKLPWRIWVQSRRILVWIGISSPWIGLFSGLEFAATFSDWKIPPDCRIGVPGLAQNWLQLPRYCTIFNFGFLIWQKWVVRNCAQRNLNFRNFKFGPGTCFHVDPLSTHKLVQNPSRRCLSTIFLISVSRSFFWRVVF